jgi:hypothetical protein
LYEDEDVAREITASPGDLASTFDRASLELPLTEEGSRFAKLARDSFPPRKARRRLSLLRRLLNGVAGSRHLP